MEILEEIKNEVAKENGYMDWNDLHEYYVEINSPFNIILEQVAKRYAQSVADDLRERIAGEVDWSVWQNDDGQEPYYHKDNIFIDRSKIRKTEIILK